MSTRSSAVPTVEVRRANGEVQEISGEELREANASPRPLDDEELEGVSGALSGSVTFADGCVVWVYDAPNGAQFYKTAEFGHAMMHS